MNCLKRSFSVAMAGAVLAGSLVFGASATPAASVSAFSALLPAADISTPIFCSDTSALAQLCTANTAADESASAVTVLYAAVSVNLRDAASTDANVITTLSTGSELTVTGACTDNWFPVSCGDLTGYVSADYVTSIQPPVTMYATSKLNLRDGASTDANIIDTVSVGDELAITGEAVDGWYTVTYGDITCYASADYVSDTKPDVSSSTSSSIASYALQFVGCSYRYGATGPSVFDCSGFTRYVYAHFGISLVHSAAGQAGYGTAVSKSELQPGDLVFFYSPISHVGIYIGNGQFVHASNSRTGVIVSNLNDSYYSSHYAGARHIA